MAGGTELDYAQIIQSVYDPTDEALNVNAVITGGGGTPATVGADGSLHVDVMNSLVPTAYNEIDLTYVPSGNGAGQIATAVYKLSSTTVATLTLSYNSSNQLISVVKS